MSTRALKLLVTGGEQRENAAWHPEYHHYRKGVLAEVDLEARTAVRVFEHVTEPGLCADKLPSIVFKSATLAADRLYLSTETEVLILSYPDLRLVRQLSHPAFNDVHHVVPWNGGLLVASSGLDLVIAFDAELRAVEFLPVLDEPAWGRFSPQVDYRRVQSTKPHRAHPNFLFILDGEPWVTRAQQMDAICLRDPSKRIEIGVALVHDGIVVGDHVFFTAVNGHVAVAHSRTHKIESLIDLAAITGTETPLGWSRGLLVEGDQVWVGFSRLRPTKIYENLRWFKRRLTARGDEPTAVLPTRIARYDLSRREKLDELDLEGVGMGALFSILPHDASCSQLAHECVSGVSTT
ncbi:MAG: hypothetical protein WEF50_14775 [Myxococcota bacterium]